MIRQYRLKTSHRVLPRAATIIAIVVMAVTAATLLSGCKDVAGYL